MTPEMHCRHDTVLTVRSMLLGLAKYSYAGIFIALRPGITGLSIPDETLMAYAGYIIFCMNTL